MTARLFWLVALGGAIGSGARILLGLAAQGIDAPLAGTLAANVLGSALIGWLAARDLSAPARAVLMTGFCGGFTTFSMLSFEIVILSDPGPLAALGYAVLTLLACGGAVALGNRVGRN